MDRFLTCVLLWLCAFERFCDGLTNGDGDECMTGFMSVDRMDALLGNLGDTTDSGNTQAIFPEVSFTCDGSIQRWVLGARWDGHEEYIELQIWRPTGNGAYTKVGYTTIIVNGPAALYVYVVSPPLAFQAGDVLGYYQPDPSRSQLRVRFEREGREPQLVYFYTDPTSPASVLNITATTVSNDIFQILVNVVTDPPGCGCGFISVERMRYVLNVDSVSSLVFSSQRQQISPEMRFTCDGNITKWIIGADYDEDVNFYPELQIWRNAGDETYRKINGTFIELQTSVSSRIYEYEDFSPIPVKSGDILGIFLPPHSSSRIRLRSELADSPAQFYFSLQSVSSSPFDEIDLEQDSVVSGPYHPLVSVAFVRESAHSILKPPSYSTEAPTPKTSPVKPTPMAPTESYTTPTQSSTTGSGVYIGVGVGVVVLLIAAGLIIISVTVCLRRRSKKLLVTASNVAYHSTSGQLSMTHEPSTEEYDYVSTHRPHPPHPGHTHSTSEGGVIISSNDAYGATLAEDMTENVAYGSAGQSDMEQSGNVAYGVCHTAVREHRDNDTVIPSDVSGDVANKAYGVHHN